MKKILSFFSAISLIATSSTTVLSCTQKETKINYLDFFKYDKYSFKALYNEKIAIENLTGQFNETYNAFISHLSLDDWDDVFVDQLQTNIDFMQRFMTKRMIFEMILFVKGIDQIKHGDESYIIYGFDLANAKDYMPYFHQLEDQYYFVISIVKQLQKQDQFSNLKIDTSVDYDFLSMLIKWIYTIQKSPAFNLNYLDY